MHAFYTTEKNNKIKISYFKCTCCFNPYTATIQIGVFKKLHWLTFPKRVQYHTCLMVYKGINGPAPEYISSMLTYVSEKHERHTRSTALDLLHIPRTHTSCFDRAFSVQGPKLWNSLPADIRNSPTVNRFKSALKRYLLINS